MTDEPHGAKHQFVTDSAIVLAIGSALLYFVGDTARTFRFRALEVPWDFVRPISVQENLREGGVALLLIIPLIGICDLLFSILKRYKPSTRLGMFRNMRPARLALLAAYCIAATFLLADIVTSLSPVSPARFLVVQISFKNDAIAPRLPAELYYVSANDHELVFVDRIAEPAPNVILVSRDQIATIVLRPPRPGR